jgi:hypothetical protein
VTDLGVIDLIDEVPGVRSFEDLWDRSSIKHVYELTLRIAALDDLIAMKRAAGRTKDQGHLEELEALRRLIRDSDKSPEET